LPTLLAKADWSSKWLTKQKSRAAKPPLLKLLPQRRSRPKVVVAAVVAVAVMTVAVVAVMVAVAVVTTAVAVTPKRVVKS
jgi:hypothetical protein